MRAILSVLIFLSGVVDCRAEKLAVKNAPVVFIGIEPNEPEKSDLDIEMLAGYIIVSKTKYFYADNSPVLEYFQIGLCDPIYRVEVSSLVPLEDKIFKQIKILADIEFIDEVSKYKDGDITLKKVRRGRVTFKVMNEKRKSHYENLIKKRREEYCPKPSA